ncbi:MAG: hypothetical protein RR517_30445 [Pseudomonas sp.]
MGMLNLAEGVETEAQVLSEKNQEECQKSEFSLRSEKKIADQANCEDFH